MDELKIILDRYEIKNQSHIYKNEIKIKDSKNNIGTEEFEIDNYLYNIYLLSQKVLFDINNGIMRSLFEYLKISKTSSIVIGRDKNNLEIFLNKFWNIKETINNNKKNQIISISNDPYIPDVIIEHKDIKVNKNYEVIYLMFSVIEIGYSKTLIFKKSNFLNKINANSFLFLVVEDFDLLEDITEGLEAILDFRDEIIEYLEANIEKLSSKNNIKNKVFILINSENPIYNLAFIECQLNECKNINDEKKLLEEITNKY